MSANAEAQCAGVSEDNTRLSTTSQGYVLPEGKIMPNTVFVGGIDIRMNEAEIRSFFERYGTVKEVKIITDRTGVSKGYGFVSFLDNVDVQKIVESQINFHGKRLKLGPAIRKQQNLCSYVHPRPLVFNPPAPQFHSVWGNQNTETYMQPPAVMSPVTQYVQSFLLQTYPYSSPALLIQQQVPVGYQPAYNYQVQPQWLAGEQRNYVMPPVYTSVSYHCTEDPEFIQTECAVPEPTQSSTNSPQKERKAHHFRKGRAVLKSV
nr:deleted in azoospermia-like isoform X5 [Columba livia]